MWPVGVETSLKLLLESYTVARDIEHGVCNWMCCIVPMWSDMWQNGNPGKELACPEEMFTERREAVASIGGHDVVEAPELGVK